MKKLATSTSQPVRNGAQRPADINLSDSVLAQLQRVIAKLPAHAALPPERALCAEFGVSRTTMRTALMNLTHSGQLYRHTGRGTFVAPPLPLTGRQIEIAVISPWHPVGSSYYYGPILRALQEGSAQQGFALRFFEETDLAAALQRETWKRGTALLLWTAAEAQWPALQAWRDQSQTPFTVLSASSSRYPDMPCVDADNRGGSQLAIRHLHSLGHRAIGVVAAGRRSPNHRHRIDGCCQILGAPHNHWLFACEPDEPWLPMLEVWRRQHSFSALYFLDLAQAVEWLEVVRAAGLRIPDDISLVAFDDDPLLDRAGYGITAISQPGAAMARHALVRLCRALLNGTVPTGTDFFPTQLILRSSTRETA